MAEGLWCADTCVPGDGPPVCVYTPVHQGVPARRAAQLRGLITERVPTILTMLMELLDTSFAAAHTEASVAITCHA